MDTLTLSRQKDGSWKAQSNGKSVSFTLHSGNPLTALQSFIGWSSWPLDGAPMPKRIRAFIRATQPSLIDRMESGYRVNRCAKGLIMMTDSDKLAMAVQALKRITVEHTTYKYDGNSQYEIGIVDGHRCAANIARKALDEIAR